MALLMAAVIGLLIGCSVFLLLQRQSFSIVLGLLLLSYGANLFVFAAGGLTVNQPPLGQVTEGMADPLPQALVLTAIVISLAMTAFVLVLVLRGAAALGTDRIGDIDERAGDCAHTVIADRQTRPDAGADRKDSSANGATGATA